MENRLEEHLKLAWKEASADSLHEQALDILLSLYPKEAEEGDPDD